MQNIPEFTIFCGPMWSTKTSKLLMTLEKYKYQNKKIIAFKPSMDSRYSDGNIVSHMGWQYPSTIVENGVDILKFLSESSENYDVIAVDEQFMIKGSADVLVWLFRKGFTVIVSTLDLSSSGKPFEEVQKIFSYATRIEKCSSVCTVCGSDAHYTHRKCKSDDEISVGGEESYEPRCYHHFAAMNEKV